jgi:hypothetical protein
MKSNIKGLTDSELADYPIQDILEGWFFRVRYFSNGFFRVEGIDRWGRKVSRSANIDVEDAQAIDELINACVDNAREIQARLGKE